jgi:hypothetical protein
MRLQGDELPSPHCFGRFEPRLQGRHGLVAQAIDTHARVEFVAVFFHQPALAQGFQVPTHRRKRNAGRLGKFPGAARPIAQQVHDAPTMWIRKRGERAVEIVGAHVNVWYLNPVACSISSREAVLTGCEKVQ